MRIVDVFQTKSECGISAVAGIGGPEPWSAVSRLNVSVQLRTLKSAMSLAAITRLCSTSLDDVSSLEGPGKPGAQMMTGVQLPLCLELHVISTKSSTSTALPGRLMFV